MQSAEFATRRQPPVSHFALLPDQTGMSGSPRTFPTTSASSLSSAAVGFGEYHHPNGSGYGAVGLPADPMGIFGSLNPLPAWLLPTSAASQLVRTSRYTQFRRLSSGPSGITAGPDGNLWFTEKGSGNIAMITTNGTITEFSSRPLRVDRVHHAGTGWEPLVHGIVTPTKLA